MRWAWVLIWGIGMALTGCSNEAPMDRIDIGQSLSAVDALPCFARADKVIPITFPGDLGSHDRFQTEWWYYTGNLDCADGRHFGYQLTFFRRALLCEESVRENGVPHDLDSPRAVSLWRTNQLYLAHFAVTDIEARTFYSDHRMSRQALGLAGADADPYRVWLGRWQVESRDSDGEEPTVHLTAHDDDFGVDLTLVSVKPTVFQGVDGLSRKSRKEGNASYYYSMTRSETRGSVKTKAGQFDVTGTSWFDHEWSTSALGADERGWDWIAVHLTDQRDLMVCQVRKTDGTPNAFAFGCLSYPDGQYAILNAADFTLQVQEHWKSETTGARYPSKWRLTISRYDLEMTIAPYLNNQEHLGDFIYWEGCVKVSGKNLSGFGYAELTGYDSL